MSDNIGNKWNISFEYERNFWRDNLLNKFIFIPDNCSLCSSTLSINENESTCNPYTAKCKNNKCRKIVWLRNYSPFNINKFTPCSVLYYIIMGIIANLM